jgi:hypothetical protein
MHIDAVAKLLRLTQDEPPSKSGDKAAVEEEFKVSDWQASTAVASAELFRSLPLHHHAVHTRRLRTCDACSTCRVAGATPSHTVRGGHWGWVQVLVLDRHTRDLIAPLLKVNDLRRHGVTLHLLLESDRQPIPDVPAVYFVRPSRCLPPPCSTLRRRVSVLSQLPSRCVCAGASSCRPPLPEPTP